MDDTRFPLISERLLRLEIETQRNENVNKKEENKKREDWAMGEKNHFSISTKIGGVCV
jgi:hypothetical protein